MEECDKLVTATYRRVLEAAKEKGLSSVAFPLVCGGMFRGKQLLKSVLEMGLIGIRDAVYPGLREVHVVAFTPEEQEALTQACSSVLPGSVKVMEKQDDPQMSQSAAVEKLTGAYCNVLSQAAQLGKSAMRLCPISDSVHAAHLSGVLPEITGAALARAVRQLPTTTIEQLPRTVEFCVDDAAEAVKYERVLKELCSAS